MYLPVNMTKNGFVLIIQIIIYIILLCNNILYLSNFEKYHLLKHLKFFFKYLTSILQTREMYEIRNILEM